MIAFSSSSFTRNFFSRKPQKNVTHKINEIILINETLFVFTPGVESLENRIIYKVLLVIVQA